MTMTQNGVFTSMMASAKTHFHLLVEVFLICSLLTARADTVTNTWWDNSPHGKFHHAEELIKGVDFQGSNVVRDVSAGVKLLQEVVIDTEGSVSNLDARADALHWLGYCHYVGMGVPKNQAKAVELFAKAGEKGKCWAVTDLAMCHALGTGVPQDKSKAVALFERAVKEGFSADKGTSDAYYIRMASLLGDNFGIAHVARYNLALCQMIGFGCPTNMARAAQLLGIAERQFTTSEQGLLAAYYFAKLGDKKTAGEILSERIEKLSGANIEDAREELGNDVWIKRFVVPCDELLSEMAEAGIAGAKEQLCLRLFAGNFMDRDVKRAFSIFRELPKTKNRLWVLTGLFDMTVINFPQDQAAVIAMSEQMADNGDSDIAHWLGGVYLKGVGAIPVNPQKGVSYVAKAAAGGLAVAQFDLGCLYCHGMHGLPIDVPRGIQLCETAATNGYTDAWLALGLMHAEGEIIPKDLSKGVAYMRRGAEAGDKHAQLTLGGCYTYGDYGVKVDKFEGFKWISMAYSNGNEQAFVFLSNAYAYGLGVERNVFKAIHFALAAVDIGDERGDAIIAAIKPVDESPESPGDGDLSKIRADAEKGDARSQYLLARAYYYGKGFEKDLTKALFWADKSAAQNYPDAANLISVYYYNGEDTKKNFVESEKWLKKAVALGSLKAMYNMSLRCHDGTGMKRDDALANQLARAAAVCGYAPAQLLYGRYLVEGIGVAQNLEQAKEWIQAAADNGYRPAQQIIRKNEEADSPSPARNWH